MNTPPIIAFNYLHLRSAQHLIRFSTNSKLTYDTDGNIRKYIWDFGDGSPKLMIYNFNLTNTSTVSYVFPYTRTFPVTLTAVDNWGLNSSLTLPVFTGILQSLIHANNILNPKSPSFLTIKNSSASSYGKHFAPIANGKIWVQITPDCSVINVDATSSSDQDGYIVKYQ